MVKNELLTTIGEILKLSKNIMEKVLSCQDITPTQNMVLVYINNQKLHEGKDVNQKDIERKFKIKASSVNSLIVGMENKGYIMRQPSERDKRINCLNITEKGMALLDKGREVIERVREIMFNNVTDSEQDMLLNLLNKIKFNLVNEQA